MRKVINLLGIFGMFFLWSNFTIGGFYIDYYISFNTLCLVSAVIFFIMMSVELLMYKITWSFEPIFPNINTYVYVCGILVEAFLVPYTLHMFSKYNGYVNIHGIITYTLVTALLILWQFICLDDNPYLIEEY